MKNLYLQTRGNQINALGDDREFLLPLVGHHVIVTDHLGNPRALSPYGFFTTFPLLPATTQAAANEKFLVSLGTGTEVIARAAKGGVNVKTQASSPADNDNAMLVGVATTAGITPITAVSRIRFATRVNLTQITELQFGAGLDENLTSPIGSGTAGEGAQFLFDPADELSTGKTVANWILATKVDGTDAYLSTTVPVIAGRDYELVIEIGADLKPKFYIDGVLVGTGVTALTSGDSVGPVVGVQINAGSPAGQKDFDCRYVSVERFIG